jgi:DNA-binding GntR family transcriptional regulator
MTYTGKAYTSIKRNIMENRYPPGYQALEQELATELGMSRTPVREALIRLEKEGLVELVSRRGMRVIPLSPHDMKEIYEVLTGLETLALSWMEGKDPTTVDFDPLEKNLYQMVTALTRDDLDSWAKADAQFHMNLISLCNNRRLANMAATLSDQAHRARMMTLRMRPRPDQSNIEHSQVLEALKQGQWEKARHLHHQHRTKTAENLLNILEYYRLSQL